MLYKIFSPNVKKLTKRKDVDGLINALGYKKDISIRSSAAKALGEIKDPKAVEPLIASFKYDNIDEEAAYALRKIKDPRAIEPLIFAALNGNFCKSMYAGFALGHFHNPQVVDYFIDLLNERNKAIREKAIESLERINDPRAIKPLIENLCEDNNSNKVKTLEAIFGLINYDIYNLSPYINETNQNQVIKFIENYFNNNHNSYCLIGNKIEVKEIQICRDS